MREGEANEETREERPRFNLAPWLVLAAAASVVVVLLVPGIIGNGSSPGETSSEATLLPLVGTDPLPRHAVVLRWTGGAEGAVYAVEILDELANVIDRAADLTVPEYQVPADRLAGIPSGATLRCRIGAVLPDGTRVESPLFPVPVQ